MEYGKTPLEKKLGIKDGYKLLLYNQPPYYFDLFVNLPHTVEVIEDIDNHESYEFIHLFLSSYSELEGLFPLYKEVLLKNGLIWISWPKKASGVDTDLSKDLIRNYIINNGLIDAKVASIDEIWSGLMFVYRLKDR